MSNSVCTCLSPDGTNDNSYVDWIGLLLGICIDQSSWRDVIAALFIALHCITWFIVILPQLLLNYRLQSADNLSLLYVFFFLSMEICFLIAAVLERWTYFFLAFRSWRTVMTLLLFLQCIYYKSCRRSVYAEALLPQQRGMRGGAVYEEGEGEESYEIHRDMNSSDEESMYTHTYGYGGRTKRTQAMQWPGGNNGGNKRSGKQAVIVNNSPSAGNVISGAYGLQPSWSDNTRAAAVGGEALLANEHRSAALLAEENMYSSSPSRSRLPASHAHLLAQPPARTISPSHPIIRPVTTHVASSLSTSATTIATLPTTSATSSSLPQQQQQQHHRSSSNTRTTSVTGIAAPTSNPSSVPGSPSAATPSSAAFRTSPSSAFTPVGAMLQNAANQSDVFAQQRSRPSSALRQSPPILRDTPPQLHSQQQSATTVAVADDSGANTAAATAAALDAAASSPSRSSSGSGGGSSLAKLAVVGTTLVCVALYSAGAPISASAPSSTLQPHSAASRMLLFASSPAANTDFSLQSLQSLMFNALIRDDASNTTTTQCNDPYYPPNTLSYVIRVFQWLACVLGCLSFFAQFIHNDACVRSTRGLSFTMFTLMIVGNLAWVIGVSLPEHNDWLANRLARERSDEFEQWYTQQFQLPILIAYAFNAVQILVLVVQRAKYKAARAVR